MELTEKFGYESLLAMASSLGVRFMDIITLFVVGFVTLAPAGIFSK
jgi:hypothetical protein